MTSKLFQELLEGSRALRKERRDRLRRLRSRLKGDSADADGSEVRSVRAQTGLSQRQFAELIGIEVATLRNWEQGRRAPTGPARALLRAIKNNPAEVVKALNQ